MAKQTPVQKAKSARQLRRQQPAVPQPPSVNSSTDLKIGDALGPSFLVPIFTSIIVLGYLLLARGVATLKGNELSRHQSLFTAVNAATLTGFQQARNPDDYTDAGKLLVFGLMLSGMLFSFICGGAAVIRIARLRFGMSHLFAWSAGSILIVGLVGGKVLQMSSPAGSEHLTFDSSVFLAISAFGNCGLTLGSLPNSSSAGALLVLLPLVVLGGLGLPVLMDAVDRLRGRGPLCRHSRTVFNWTAGCYLFLTLTLFLLRLPGAIASFSSIKGALIDASQQAINARSAGFQFQVVSRLPQWITVALVLVMIVGASPGGSAGGVKVTTLAQLTHGTIEGCNDRNPGRPFGAAIIWLLLYLSMLLLSTIALLITEPEIHLDRTLFLAASALGNVGLSHNPIDVSTAGLYVLSVTMILGRITPVLMLWYVVDTLPQARIAVG